MLEHESGPNRLARTAEEALARLIPERDAEKDTAKRKDLNSRIHSCRILLKFAKTRAGYVS